jgi:hypothetical protein
MLLLAPIVLGLSFFQSVLAAEVTPSLDDCITDDIGLAITFPNNYDKPTNYCAMQFKQGFVIKRLEVWSSDHHVRGFKVTYTNDDTTAIGTFTNDYHDLAWDPEKVSVMRATGHDSGEESGLYIKLTDGRDLKAGLPHKWDKESTGLATHGLLIGLGATYDPDHKPWIKAITIQTLKETIANSRIHDVVFKPTVDELNRRPSNEYAPSFSVHPIFQHRANLTRYRDRGLGVENLKSGHYFNDRESDEVTISFEGRDMVETSRSWSWTATNTLHVGVKTQIEGEFGFLTKYKWNVGGELFYEHKWEHITLNSYTKQVRYP